MDLEEIRQRLLTMMAELDAHDAATKDDRAPVELDQTSVGRLSRMDSLQVQAMSAAGQQRRRNERLRIEAALARLDAGEYGYCAVCDEPIPAERLDLDPAIPTCFKCASGARA